MKNMNKQGLSFWCVLLVGLATAMVSCRGTKNLPSGESLYIKGEVEIESDTIPAQYIGPLKDDLQELVRPKPNTSFLGMRPQLALFNAIDSPKKENSIKGWLKYKVGEAPVYLSDVNLDYTQNLLRNRLENLGFFQAEVLTDTTVKKQLAKVTYTAIPGIIYRINKLEFETDSSDLGRAIQETKAGSLLTVGRPFNLNNIILERERIDNELKNLGFYYFSADYLLVEVDSSGQDHQVDLYLTVKRETPEKAKQKYRINNIVIYPNDLGNQTAVMRNRIPRNAELYKNEYFFVDPANTFRKFALARTMFFKKGDVYTRTAHTQTLNQLVNMGAFRLVKNDFVDVDTGKNLLDVYYYLTPMPKRGLRIEMLGKTASVYNGSEINVNWAHRNLFRSGEVLNLTVFGGFETQTGGNVSLNSSFRRYGAELSLFFPRMIAPFNWQPSRNFVPRTFIKTGYEFLDRRSAYSLNSLKFSAGYQWKETIKKEHELSVIDVAYVQPRNITASYQEQIDTIPALRHTVEPQFTFGPTYSFTFTNTMDAHRQDTYYFRTGMDLSANIYGLIKGSNYKNGNVYQLFGADFSQYAKFDADFRHYRKLNTNLTWASRAFVGIGLPYGNSSALPYVKQYFAGGPNSLKGFRARSVGPGTMEPTYLDKDHIYADQTGDLKLELNTEFRAKLYSLVHGAVFLDAGNVWLLHEDPNKAGAQFSSSFLKEMAVSTGLGLRFDLSFLVLRTDVGIPLRVPYRAEGSRWVFNEINFNDKEWRRHNLIFNLAIGYPF